MVQSQKKAELLKVLASQEKRGCLLSDAKETAIWLLEACPSGGNLSESTP
jgi:hypothetical protein